jgi:cytochrome c oxidase assembly factor CtaG
LHSRFTSQETTRDRGENPRRRTAGTTWILFCTVLPLVVVAVAVVLIGRSSYDALSRDYPGLATSLLSGLLRVTVDLSGALCLGSLFVAAFIVARQGRNRLALSNSKDLCIVRWSSLIWALGGLLLIFVDSADANGQPVSRVLTPGSVAYLVQASYLPGAWIVAALCAFAIFWIANFAQAWQTLVFLIGVAILAMLAPVLVGQVLVGPNHDFAGDASIFGVPAAAAWFGATVVIAIRWYRDGRPSQATLNRFRILSILTSLITTLSLVIVMLFELSGQSPLASMTGVLILVKLGLLAAIGAIGVLVWRRSRRITSPGTGTPGLSSLIAAAGLMTLFITVSVIMTRIPPPQYFAPTSTMQLFLGFDVTPTPTASTLVFDWRLNILFAVVAAAAVGFYVAGVIRLQRRGDHWPVGRTVAWVLGWTVIVLTTSSGLGRYSSVSFSLHMLLHMSLNMLGPLLLVLGGAITLALRATTPHRRSEPAGAHEWITALLNWRLTRSIYNPLHVFISFVGSYYVLYLTDIFGEALRYHWAHQVMNLEFVFIGYLFYGLVIGVDHPPRPLPHIGKLGMVLAAMPFHAFFGVIIMSSTTLIAGLFYSYVGAPWMTDLPGDQYLGGGIAWAAGELPLIVVIIALVTQWSKQDARRAARLDRHADEGLDDSYEGYNDMLARLAGRPTVSPNSIVGQVK